ncbi:hypothetical protein [Myroides odoratimimus]|uniref:hypothetical protein n=1 Tax=Myroides odoratimimus TaxID=76832 RepID=UPI0025758FEC|nr:hypothetical protein [Myroides odoratimimus]MDM1500004.1 hypothetical protein [Myroides odoratimimus]
MKESNSKRIVFLAPVSAVNKRLRLRKVFSFLQDEYKEEKKLRYLHLGWEREKGESRFELKEIKQKIILKGGGYGGSLVKARYILWIICSFMSCLRLKKNDLVWALGFESAFPALIASKIIGFKVIMDDADRFSLVFSFPVFINRIIQKLETWTSLNVFLHIIPGYERYEFTSPNFFLLKNTPSHSEVEKARKLEYREVLTNEILEEYGNIPSLVIYINGWLASSRGIDIALKVVKEMNIVENNNILFLVAGRIASNEAKELIEFKNVKYLGELSNSDALAAYFLSDFVLTYFAPSSIINKFAESNKWGDALKIGVGVIVNNEVVTADYLRRGGVSISNDYNDVKGLVAKLNELIVNPDLKQKYKSNSLLLSNKFGYFEEQLKDLFSNHIF